jgi:hypothetical protein
MDDWNWSAQVGILFKQRIVEFVGQALFDNNFFVRHCLTCVLGHFAEKTIKYRF